MSVRKTFDAVVAGLAVADVIGWPVDLRHPPHLGSLAFLEGISLAVGGNVCNVGTDLAKLGHRVAALTRLGRDSLGDFVLGELRRSGVNTSYTERDARLRTSATFVCVDRSGERTFLHTRGCMAHFRRAQVDRSLGLISRSRFFILGYLGLLPELEPDLGRLLKTVKALPGVRTVLDTGGLPRRRGLRSLGEILPWVDYIFPSLEEARMLTGRRTPAEITRFLFSAGAPHVTGVKLGSEGCYIAVRDGMSGYVPPLRVRRVVDATGAGDAFVAGFTAATLRGYGPFDAARIGNAVAAGSLGAVGASAAVGPFSRYAHMIPSRGART